MVRSAAGSDSLSKVEKELMKIAARLNQAMIFREKNEIDELWYAQSIEEELVRHSTSLFQCTTKHKVQASVNEIYAGAGEPRMHPVIWMIAEEFQRASESGKPLNFDAFSAARIRKKCLLGAREHPEWTKVLNRPTLASLLDRKEKNTHWWLPGEKDFNDDDSEDGK